MPNCGCNVAKFGHFFFLLLFKDQFGTLLYSIHQKWNVNLFLERMKKSLIATSKNCLPHCPNKFTLFPHFFSLFFSTFVVFITTKVRNGLLEGKEKFQIIFKKILSHCAQMLLNFHNFFFLPLLFKDQFGTLLCSVHHNQGYHRYDLLWLPLRSPGHY